MARLRLFGPLGDLAGVRTAEFAGAKVEDVLLAANLRFGEEFTSVASRCRVWVNGEPATETMEVRDTDEVALLPPVSGG